MDELTLTELLEDCAGHLRGECIERTGVATFSRLPGATLSLGAPPLIPEGRIGPVSMGAFPGVLYAPPRIPTVDEVTATWHEAVPPAMSSRPPVRLISSRLRQVFPTVPFWAPPNGDARAMLVQFLVVASWFHGRLRFTSQMVELRMPEWSLTIEKHAAEGKQQRWRSADPLTFNPLAVVSMQLGLQKRASTRFASLYRYLQAALPDYASEVTTLFAAALHGSENGFEEVILNHFDAADGMVRGDHLLWSEALRLIDRSVRDPYKELMTLVVPCLMSRAAFETHFGRSGRRAKVFTSELRHRYRAALLKAEGEIAPVVQPTVKPEFLQPQQQDDASAAAAQLLQLQHLL